jgi:hypothetical protein
LLYVRVLSIKKLDFQVKCSRFEEDLGYQRHTRLTTRNDYDCDLLVDVRVEISLRQMVYTESD